jgi:D-3-phosphoglycerate dehydrogenase
VEEKRSDEPVTFNEWLHVQVYNGATKVVSAGGTFFGSPNNPRIVRLFSQPVEIPISGTILLVRNHDRPGIVGHLGTVLGSHGVNIANMSLARDAAGGQALTVLHLDSAPPQAALDELAKDPSITSARVVVL